MNGGDNGIADETRMRKVPPGIAGKWYGNDLFL
jgi:hypothetical protein